MALDIQHINYTVPMDQVNPQFKDYCVQTLKIKVLVPVYSDKDNKYTNIPRDIILSITNLTAGGLFVYLCYLSTQHENHIVVCKSFLQNHLNISKKKLDSGLVYLIDKSLISMELLSTKRI